MHILEKKNYLKSIVYKLLPSDIKERREFKSKERRRKKVIKVLHISVKLKARLSREN